MRYHVAQFDEPREQIDQARALLEFMASASQGSGPYGDLLGREVERLSRSSNSYLFHEHLEPTNSPIYFHEFVERAERAGLLYLSEASVSDMLTSHFPRHVAETLERISPDLLHLEQYLDFVRNRQFRQSLLCHAGRKPNRALSPASLAGLLVSSRALPEGGDVNLTDGVAVGFSNGKQRATATRPASKAAFALLTEHWPRALAVDALCDLAMARATPFLDGASGDSRDAMLGDLFGGVVYGMVETHTQPPRCTASPSERPGALPFAFHQSQQNSFVVNAHHDTCLLEGMALEVLKLCDGRRSRGDIVNELVGRHQNGTLQIDVDGRVVVSPDEARTVIGDRVQRALVSLTRDALLLQ
jgi:methyltransferase-like protein